MVGVYEHYSTNFDADFQYTDVEVDAIVEALAPITTARVDRQFLLFMLGGIDAAVKGTREEIPAQERRILLTKARLHSCRLLLLAVKERAAQEEFWVEICLNPADHLGPVSSSLRAAAEGYKRELIMERRLLKHLIGQSPKTEQSRPVADAIFNRCASAWEYYGGKVGDNSNFRSFFKAVTDPKFLHPRVGAELKISPTTGKLAAFLKKRKPSIKRKLRKKKA